MKIQEGVLSTLFTIFCMLSWSSFAETVHINRVRSYADANHTRVVFDISEATIYRLFSLANPDRLVIDLVNAQDPPSWPSFKQLKSPILKIRSSIHGKHVLRVVLDLKHVVKVHSFSLPPQGENGHRLVVDLMAPTTENQPNNMAVKPAKTLNRAKQPKLIVNQTLPTKAPRDVVVVIDPGHGGKDPGAIGSHHVQEKEVVLSIARKLKTLIDERPGMRAVLTRRGDYYIGLRQRIRMARRDKADLFVAIHADAYRNRSSHGASVFALSARGASSEAARWLAEKENQSELLGGADLADKDHMLRSVLLDLSQTATISASLGLGEAILGRLSHISQLHHPHVEQAGFVVLKSPDIPSVLVETGFLSNQREAIQLTNANYQGKLANAIANGIEKYLTQHPPAGTRYYKQWQQVS